MADEPDVVQIQMDIQSAVDEAVRNIREHALRQVMVMVNRMMPELDERGLGDTGFIAGYMSARELIYDEIEAMIAKDAAT